MRLKQILWTIAILTCAVLFFIGCDDIENFSENSIDSDMLHNYGHGDSCYDILSQNVRDEYYTNSNTKITEAIAYDYCNKVSKGVNVDFGIGVFEKIEAEFGLNSTNAEEKCGKYLYDYSYEASTTKYLSVANSTIVNAWKECMLRENKGLVCFKKPGINEIVMEWDPGFTGAGNVKRINFQAVNWKTLNEKYVPEMISYRGTRSFYAEPLENETASFIWNGTSQDGLGDDVRCSVHEAPPLEVPEEHIDTNHYDYIIITKTGIQKNAKVDKSKIYMRLIGTNYTTSYFYLNNSEDNFEYNKIDRFTTDNNADSLNFRYLGEIIAIDLKIIGTDGWAPEYIRVRNPDKYEEYNFFYHAFIDEDDGHPLRVRLKAYKDYSRYNFYVRTGTRKSANTDDKVFLKLYGTKGQFEYPIFLDNYKRDDFERGSVGHYELIHKDLGDITKLEVKLKGNDGWFLENITIEKENYFPDSFSETYFEFNSWLDGDNPEYKSSVMLYPKK